MKSTSDRTLTSDERPTPGEHGHPTTAHRDACPVCNPDKTVPQLNDAYRAEVARTSNERLVNAERLLKEAIDEFDVFEDPRDTPSNPMKLLVSALAEVQEYRRAHETSACPISAVLTGPYELSRQTRSELIAALSKAKGNTKKASEPHIHKWNKSPTPGYPDWCACDAIKPAQNGGPAHG